MTELTDRYDPADAHREASRLTLLTAGAALETARLLAQRQTNELLKTRLRLPNPPPIYPKLETGRNHPQLEPSPNHPALPPQPALPVGRLRELPPQPALPAQPSLTNNTRPALPRSFQNGDTVRSDERGNIGTITRINTQRTTAEIRFVNRRKGTEATIKIALNKLTIIPTTTARTATTTRHTKLTPSTTRPNRPQSTRHPNRHRDHGLDR